MKKRFVEGRGFVSHEELVEELEAKKRALGGTLGREEEQKLKSLRISVEESFSEKVKENDAEKKQNTSSIVKLREKE